MKSTITIKNKNENGTWIDKKGQEWNKNHTVDNGAKLTSKIALQIKGSITTLFHTWN